MGLKDLFAKHSGEGEASRHTINVEGMHCNACEKLVADALTELGAKDVVADHETNTVSYVGELDESCVASAVAEAGFTVA